MLQFLQINMLRDWPNDASNIIVYVWRINKTQTLKITARFYNKIT